MSYLAEASLKEEFRHRNAYFSSTIIFIGCVHGEPMTAVTRVLSINNGPELVWEHHYDYDGLANTSTNPWELVLVLLKRQSLLTSME